MIQSTAKTNLMDLYPPDKKLRKILLVIDFKGFQTDSFAGNANFIGSIPHFYTRI
tara:strand:- start:2043 stop:2207 length:165 start_codon:yes stop_codon:yes gene_type:complete